MSSSRRYKSPFQPDSQENSQDIPLLRLGTTDTNASSDSQQSTSGSTAPTAPIPAEVRVQAPQPVNLQRNPFLTSTDYFSPAPISAEVPSTPGTIHSATSYNPSLLSSLNLGALTGGSLLSPIDTSESPNPSKRHSQLRGVDTSARSAEHQTNTSSTVFTPGGDGQADTTLLKLGLEDALGKDGNWLTKKPDTLGLPEVNRDRISVDFERPASQVFMESNTRVDDPLRDAEEGLIVHTAHASNRVARSPVKNISRAVKTLSTRVMGQKEEDEHEIEAKSPAPSVVDTAYHSPFQDAPLKSPNFEKTDPNFQQKSYYNTNFRYNSQFADTLGTESLPDDITEDYSIAPTDSIATSTHPNPPPPPPPLKLIGKSLKFFSPDSSVRLFLYHQLHKVWVEPFSFFLIISQTVVLTVGNVKNIYGDDPDSSSDSFVFPDWKDSWVNWAHLAIFICYTLIAAAKIIAYGLWDDSQRKRLMDKHPLEGNLLNSNNHPIPQSRNIFSQSHLPGSLRKRFPAKNNVPLVPTFANLIPRNRALPNQENPFMDPQGYQIQPERAFLRSSWNRVQFIAIISYWISFFLMINHTDANSEIFVFRMLAGLPILHLLNLTSGTSSVLKSLKAAAPLLVSVGIFVGFFW